MEQLYLVASPLPVQEVCNLVIILLLRLLKILYSLFEIFLNLFFL